MRLFIFFLTIFVYIGAKDNVTTSLIIPCCAQHAPCLHRLLQYYEQQTQLPDEVIISLSEADKVPAVVFEKLCNDRWAFPITLLLFNEKRFAGENRNSASERAQGDIFIYQDADDVPHPQRIEIIAYFFKRYQIDHLMHQWIPLRKGQKMPYKLYTHIYRIPFFYPKNFTDVWYLDSFTNGNAAIARHVFDAVKWSNRRRGQDTIFNYVVYSRFKKCMAVRVRLLGVRTFLSSNKEYDTDHSLLEQELLPITRNELGKQHSITIVHP